MSLPAASTTPVPVPGALARASSYESHNRDIVGPASSFGSSQGSSDSGKSMVTLETSFRLDPPYTGQSAESEKHPKGKRKRTTSQDKTILEAAYNANPKPDKAARVAIVGRVTLNEKEVQIWFQNRRQNDRRKSRPLSPQEIEALRHGGAMRVLSSDSAPKDADQADASSCPFAASKSLPKVPNEKGGCVDVDAEKDRQSPDLQDMVAPQTSSEPSSPKVADVTPVHMDGGAKHEPELGGLEAKETSQSSQRSELEGDVHALSQTSTLSVGYLSNRWNVGNALSTPSTLERDGDDSFRLESFPSSASSTANDSPGPVLPPPSSSASSKIRLSLSLEGKAELVASQSPPRPTILQQQSQPLPISAVPETLPPVRAHRPLHRSQSALPSVTLPPISTLTAHLPPRLNRGRSRNVHAWESCAEADLRDELTRQAENESSGSAIAAISLLRSTSGSSTSASLGNLVHKHNNSSSGSLSGILQTNPGKRNAPSSSYNHHHHKSSRDGVGAANKKPKLSRSSSSVARLQSAPAIAVPPIEIAPAALTERTDGNSKRSSLSDLLLAEPEKKSKKGDEKAGSLALILSPSGDSDKENWSPDEEGNPRQQQEQHYHHDEYRPSALPTPTTTEMPKIAPQEQRLLPPKRSLKNSRRAAPRVLGEQSIAGSGSNSRRSLFGNSNRAYTAPAGSKYQQQQRGAKTSSIPVNIFVDEAAEEHDEDDREEEEGRGEERDRPDPRGTALLFGKPQPRKRRGNELNDDDEVERFMRGGRVVSAVPPVALASAAATPSPATVSPGKRGDMDCVAGLLSLSQGNWR